MQHILSLIIFAFLTSLSFSQCDANSDGELNILDVIILVDIILYNDQCADWFECPEDINIDGNLNVLDIIELVNKILD